MTVFKAIIGKVIELILVGAKCPLKGFLTLRGAMWLGESRKGRDVRHWHQQNYLPCWHVS